MRKQAGTSDMLTENGKRRTLVQGGMVEDGMSGWGHAYYRQNGSDGESEKERQQWENSHFQRHVRG